MNGLGGLKKSENGVVIGLVPLQPPTVVTPAVNSMGDGMIVNFDGTILAHGTSGRVDEIITAEVRRDLVREARAGWGVENNPYQFGHWGYVAVKGGAQDCPYTHMTNLTAGAYRLPWEDSVCITNGTTCDFPEPTRVFGQTTQEAAE